MRQVPLVTGDDVLRVVRRDFPPAKRGTVLKLLDEYGSGSGYRERDRVQLAILKLSRGDIDQLRRYVRVARVDYRDVIAPAEYPRFWEIGFEGVERMSPAEVRRLKRDDWRQYQAWLSGG
jgi:phytoene dehydrogenase-like protein